MSPAGVTLLGRIWDYKYNLGSGDDDVGGALPSGTIVHPRIELRISQMKPTQALLEQGIEDISMFEAFIYNHTLTITNNNEIEITAPANSQHYGKHYRVVGDSEYTSLGASDSRGYLRVKLKRVEKSRTIQ